MNTSTNKFLSSCGIVAGLLMAATAILTPGEPHADNPSLATLSNYYLHNRTSVLIYAIALTPLCALALNFFGSALRSHLRAGEAGEATWSTVAGAAAPISALGLVFIGIGSVTTGEAFHNGHPLIGQTIYFAAHYSWLAWSAASSAMVLGTGIGALRTATLPKWFAIASIVLGVILITPAAFIGFVLEPLWLIAGGVLLARAGATSRVAVPAGSGLPATA